MILTIAVQVFTTIIGSVIGFKISKSTMKWICLTLSLQTRRLPIKVQSMITLSVVAVTMFGIVAGGIEGFLVGRLIKN